MSKLITVIRNSLWYLLIFLLPITSMPVVRLILGSDTVASPSILVLFILGLIWLIPGIVNKQLIPRSVIPLLLFASAAIISTCLAFFLPLPAYKEFHEVHAPIAALSTLIIGILFFIIAGSFPVSEVLKKKTFQLINWSGLLIILWSFFQAISWFTMNGYPQWMFEFQGFISSRVLFRQRVTGFALEPSWLAHQLNLFYLPYWLSSTLKKYSSQKLIFSRFSMENILFLLGSFTLGLTLSRVGYLAFFCMFLPVLWFLHHRIVRYVCQLIIEKNAGFARDQKKIGIYITIMMLFLYLLLTGAGIYILSRVDPRMTTLFSFDPNQQDALLHFFNQLKFGDRIIYWLSGWNIFNHSPILGVGLGNAGFYIPYNIEPFGWTLVEVRRLIHREVVLLNVKSLWFRLLAETGIIGFSLFIGWLLSLFSTFIKKMRLDSPLNQVLGLMGILVIVAMLFEGLSIDSFAMPYWWVSLGLASSVSIENISKS